jgi:phosphoglycerate dehydrogenase-like enzyme
MGDLFCHAATFARIEARLKPFADRLSPVTMDDGGVLQRPWGGEVRQGGDLRIVYGTQDAYFSPAAAQFFQFIMAAPSVGWFQSSAAGIEHPVLRAIGARAGAFTTSHEQSAAIAEWVLWAGLDHFQAGPSRRAAQANGIWQRKGFREIGETHWLVIGFGHIGKASATRLRALGAHVTGVRRSAGPDPDADSIIHPRDLADHLPRADAVLLSPPLTPETEDMADASFFAAMKPGALFLNVGRGKLVDENALLAGLETGRPGAACLDVVREEPLPTGHALWSHPAVTLTAHISAKTGASMRRSDGLFLENLGAFLAGTGLRNLIPRSEFEPC